jgi:putative transposase
VVGMIGGLISVERGWADGRRCAVVEGFRYPLEIISHCVWLYHRFPLRFREVEEMMLERGVVVSHETVRQWCGKFGQIVGHEGTRFIPRCPSLP